jgi:glyoxylase-like metal-dependent hydrolase (beta-lactamase superfamily II)
MSIKHTLLKLALLAPLLSCHLAQAKEPVFQPKAQLVTENVYAIVGPLGQRSEANAGLNANYGFVVTSTGVILIDSGASAHSAAMLDRAVQEVTSKPIRWVLNTGSQDHRWLGNDYFSKRGAEVHAMANTVKTQKAFSQQQLQGLERFLGQQLKGTVALQAKQVHPAPEKALAIDGVRIQWTETSAHYPGDTMIYLPDASVVFTGDLVYVDRILGVLPQSNVRKAQAGFQRLESIKPRYVVPGHGRVTDLAQAKRETGDYYDFLIKNVGAAARNMDSIGETLDKFAKPDQFKHLQNFSELHRANMNRVFVDFEANP